ncbi:Nitroreductase family protein [Microbacterium paraoxydans]|uniref:Nitroreductase family protein n=1 Tax=Microbacterium paraoxydans TaxID=199592 RepID=A0A1H1UBJ2_9MICO|nr:Nitroreductase family protein [Microbacterium paraoxydans]
MELLDAIRRRKTTNGAFLPDPVSEEHQRILLEAAGRAPRSSTASPGASW